MTNQLLPANKIKEIEGLATAKLLESCPGEEVDQVRVINMLITKEGLKLREADLQDISGVLYKEKGDGWVILVNREDSQRRKLFTIAHELGHYFLHKGEQDEFIDGQFIQTCFGRSESTKYQEQELEANEFAGNLIMPKTSIEETLKLPGEAGRVSEETVSLLAMQFKVSPHAMATRLKNLGYDL